MCIQNIQKMQLSIVLAIMVATMFSSKASIDLQGLDSIDVMPEIIVTAPRYEYANEAWLDTVEGVVIEAPRPSSSGDALVAGDESQAMLSANMTPKDIESLSMNLIDPIYLLLLLVFATLSIAYVAIRAILQTKGVKHDRTKH